MKDKDYMNMKEILELLGLNDEMLKTFLVDSNKELNKGGNKMLTKFDEDAQKAIVIAESIAFDLGYSSVGSEHLLEAITKIHSSILSQFLYKKIGLTSFGIHQQILESFGEKDDKPFYTEYSDEVKEILNQAIKNNTKSKDKPNIDDLSYYLIAKDTVAKTFLDIFLSSKQMDELMKRLENSHFHKQKSPQTPAKKLQKLLSSEDINFATVLSRPKRKVILERDKEVKDILVGLCCQNKPNVALTGKAGVGKSAIVEELDRYLQHENTISRLNGYVVVQLSLNSAVAGTKYRGEFEKKIENYLKFIKGKKIITFIDEGHQATEVGNSEGAVSFSEIIKPYLARGDYKFIIATTNDEFKYITKDAALARRFRQVDIQEPQLEKVASMISAKVNQMSRFHKVKIDKETINNIIQSCSTIPNRYFPDKAIDVIDYTMAYAEVFNDNVFDLNQSYEYIESLGGQKPSNDVDNVSFTN